ncbi:helix-turn-helix transcriptional regulator [Nonomuraea sp. NPDC050556]|uniref:helix-turn-helix transcriptional regulator n=1 Tax=Nonomuraea sp. NPDC050556 TaxID=3364369 RepID=UPI00379865A7
MDGELGEFLRSRRARIRPSDVGLKDYGRRRVPGLRREEVAQLAGVSVDYYIRLEQGRGQHVSDAILDAVANVLRLDPTERDHLRNLVRPSVLSPSSGSVREGVRTMLAGMGPAFVLGRRMDVLAWNAAMDAVTGLSGLPSPNMARLTFLDPAARTLYRDWATVAAETVAHLRLDAGRHPGDPLMEELVDELSADPTFTALWSEHQVKAKTYGVKRLRHPVLGDLDVGYETMELPGDQDQLVVVYTAPPGSETAAKLHRLTQPLAV